MSNAYLGWLTPMLHEDCATSMPKKYLSGTKSFVKTFFKKMSFESMDTIWIIYNDKKIH